MHATKGFAEQEKTTTTTKTQLQTKEVIRIIQKIGTKQIQNQHPQAAYQKFGGHHFQIKGFTPPVDEEASRRVTTSN